MITRRIAAALLVAAIAQCAAADTTLVYRDDDGGKTTVAMRPGAVRIGGDGGAWQLYKADARAIYAIDPAHRRYTRMDKHTAAAIRRRMHALREQLEARVQRLPESQRAAARAALLAKMPELDSRKHKVALDRTGASDRVAGVRCSVVQVVRDGKPGQSLCVASADALGIDSATFASVRSMFELLRTMLAGTGFEAVALPYLDLAGMPVRFTRTGTGQRQHLVGVSHQQLADSRFAIPANYTRRRLSANP